MIARHQKKDNPRSVPKRTFLRIKHFVFAAVFLVGASIVFSVQADDKTINDTTLLNDYVNSKGAGIIVFDAKNIKQFWIEKNVVSRDDQFDIYLDQKNADKKTCAPLKLQLINVNETQDCNVEVITDSSDAEFNVLNLQSKVISTSSSADDFLQYHVLTSTFHLKDTENTSFSLSFKSQSDYISIKKIILSFSENKSRAVTSSTTTASSSTTSSSSMTSSTSSSASHVFNVCEDDLAIFRKGSIEKVSENAFSLTTQNGGVLSTRKVECTDNTLTITATIKNTGDLPVHIYIGFRLYNKDNEQLTLINYPYKNNNKTFKVISTSDDKRSIVIDSYPEWEKGCYIALNAKADSSDIPNTSVIKDSRINQVDKLENGQARITLSSPLKEAIEAGEMIRINRFGGEVLFTTTNNVLQPGEEKTYTSSIRKDEESLQFASSFPHGVYYVVPLIMSTSDKDNTIQISDYLITY